MFLIQLQEQRRRQANARDWHDVNGFPGYYVNAAGQVAHRTITAADCRKLQPKVLSPSVHPSGYHMVSLYCDEGECRRYVHRIVCEAFHEPPTTTADEVNHKNKRRGDNRAENLEWTTRAGNMQHASVTATGTAVDVQGLLFMV